MKISGVMRTVFGLLSAISPSSPAGVKTELSLTQSVRNYVTTVTSKVRAPYLSGFVEFVKMPL